MCNEPPETFKLSTDDFEDGNGETLIVSCPVTICQWWQGFDRALVSEVLAVIEEHRTEGIH